MKLLRYGPAGQEKPGLLDAERRDSRSLGRRPATSRASTLLPESLERLRAIDPATLPRVAGTPRIGPCVGQVGKFICIGLNYSDHAAESGMAVPKEPIVFMKATSAIIGPNDDVVMPRGSQKTDWEVELGVVIGTAGEVRRRGGRAVACRGLLRRQRSVRARLSARRHRAVGEGQERRHVRSDRAVARDARRSPRLRRPRPVARGRRPPLSERLDEHAGLRRAVPGQLSEPLHEPAARRHHLDRHAAGRRASARSRRSTCAPATSCGSACRVWASRCSESARSNRSLSVSRFLDHQHLVDGDVVQDLLRAARPQDVDPPRRFLRVPRPTCRRTSLLLR